MQSDFTSTDSKTYSTVYSKVYSAVQRLLYSTLYSKVFRKKDQGEEISCLLWIKSDQPVTLMFDVLCLMCKVRQTIYSKKCSVQYSVQYIVQYST